MRSDTDWGGGRVRGLCRNAAAASRRGVFRNAAQPPNDRIEASLDHRATMPELYDERRQEPRFRTAGRATLTVDGETLAADVLDLSLNGLSISRPARLDVHPSQLVSLSLQVGDVEPFVADVKIVHAEKAKLGLEFFDMPPRDFAVLAGIIETFQRLRREGYR
jgi:hypothetical protein